MLILSSDKSHGFFTASAPTLITDFPDLLVISAPQYSPYLLPGLWTRDTTRKVWGAGLKKKKSQSFAVQYSLPLILELAAIALQGLLAN